MRSAPLVVVMAALLILAACSADDKSSLANDSAAEQLRIVALAPHLAELLFAAGAGEQLVGVSSYSDYPDAVLSLPVVGDAFRIDQEQLALLRPDLLLVWGSGTPTHIVDSLRQRGYRIELVNTRNLAEIGGALRHIGGLTGRQASADAAAAAFEADIERLAAQWQHVAPIRVFYQVSLRPLYTVNGQHYISELIALCGGENVFADLSELAPMISEEAVLERDPELVLSAATGGESSDKIWGFWKQLAANRYGNHFGIPADSIARPTPRVYQAGMAICAALQEGRERRIAAGSN